MNDIDRLILVAHLAATAALIISYGARSGITGLVPALAPLIVWLVLQRLRRSIAPGITLAVAVLLTIVAAVRGHAGGPLLAAMLATVFAWDLSGFKQRVTQHHSYTAGERVLRRHLNLLLTIAVVAIALFLVVRTASVQLTFWPATMLSAIVVFGIAQAFRFLRQSD